MTHDDRELADRAKQACSIIAHFPTDKDTPVEIHWLIKQAAWGLGKSTEQSFDLEKEFRARITAELAAKAVPKSTEIALWILKHLKALPNEPCLASMQIAQYVTTELFPILTAQAEAARAEVERLREALGELSKAYIGDCPAAVPYESYLEQRFRDLRQIARAALAAREG